MATATATATVETKSNGKSKAPIIASNNPPAIVKAADDKARSLAMNESKGKMARLDLAIYIGESASKDLFPASYIERLVTIFSQTESEKSLGKAKGMSKVSKANIISTYTAFYDVGKTPFGKVVLPHIDEIARKGTGPLVRGYKMCNAQKKAKAALSLNELKAAADHVVTTSLKKLLVKRADELAKIVAREEAVEEFDAKKHWPKAAVSATKVYEKALRDAAKAL